MVVPAQISSKHIEELSFEEMAFIHLSTSNSSFFLAEDMLRSTLSFLYQNVRQALSHEYSKHLMPYISLCAILDQLGTCYDRKDLTHSKYQNGIKRALVNFAELHEDDVLIDIIYALRNGLLHNISFSSSNKYKNKHYHFRYSNDIEGVYQNATLDWDGNYLTLDSDPKKYTTLLNVEKFKNLVFSCIDKADTLNQQSLLELRLAGGIRQLFFDYILTSPINLKANKL